MRAAVLMGFGGNEQLRIQDLPRPSPGQGEVLIRVSAAAVNNTDINTRVGWYGSEGWSGSPVAFPRIQGADVCGRIAEVGPDVARRRIGERVVVEPVLRELRGETLDPPWYLGSERDGGFADYVVVPSANAHPVLRDLSDAEWASFPCSYSTAEHLLTRARVVAGDDVLITGASGGVGSAAVQLALARDATVTAVTSPEKAAAMEMLGASRLLMRDDSYGQDCYDAVIDLVGGGRWPQLLRALRRGGRYATAGAVGGPHVDLDLRTLYLKDLTLHGATIYDESVFPAMLRRIEDGQVEPVVSCVLPLTEIHRAQELFTSRRHIGKIVLTL